MYFKYRNKITILIFVLASILLASPFVNIADIDAVKTNREKACANPRDPGEQDPKFCAHLIVIKNVAGGTASPSQFTISVSGNNVAPPSTFQGSSSGTTVTLSQGSYSVTETSKPPDYTPSYSSDCSGSITAGQTKTCTITNTFTPLPQTATAIVTKVVLGGPSSPEDFTICIFTRETIGGTPTPATPPCALGSGSGFTYTVKAPGFVDFSEPNIPDNGYRAATLFCRNQDTGQFGTFVAGGQTTRCELQNTFVD